MRVRHRARHDAGMSTTINVSVVGTLYRERTSIAQVAKTAAPSSVVMLEREPDNAYDANAIKVIIDNVWVGYVPRDIAATIAKMRHVNARLTHVLVNVHDDRNPIRFEIQVEVA